MKSAMNFAVSRLLVVLSTMVVATAQAHQGDVPPSADDVVAKMAQLDAERQTQLAGYRATRHYVAVNKQRRAEMVVVVTCASDGTQQFTIQSEEGSHAIRKHVFYKMLRRRARHPMAPHVRVRASPQPTTNSR